MAFKNWITKVSPTILTIIGASGTIATAIFAAKAAPEALVRRTCAQRLKGEEPLTPIEIAKAEAPAYWPAIAIGTGTICSIFGANVLNRKQQASLISAYAALQQIYDKYKYQVKTLFGDAGDNAIVQSVEQMDRDIAEDRPPWDADQTFYFDHYGKFFDRTMIQVIEAEYYLNRLMVLRGNATVNDFLKFLELDPIDDGDILGWDLYEGDTLYGYQWIDFIHRFYVTEEGLTVCDIGTPFAAHPSEDLEKTEFSEKR